MGSESSEWQQSGKDVSAGGNGDAVAPSVRSSGDFIEITGIDIPNDFSPLPEWLPNWIDVKGICKDARRFVCLHPLSHFGAVAINDGQRVYTTADQRGEFRSGFGRLIDRVVPEVPVIRLNTNDAALVYDCESRRQWLAPRSSAIRFLSRQFS